MALQAIIRVIFALYLFSRIFEKRELSENMYNAKISKFTVWGMMSKCPMIYILYYWQEN